MTSPVFVQLTLLDLSVKPESVRTLLFKFVVSKDRQLIAINYVENLCWDGLIMFGLDCEQLSILVLASQFI